MSDMTIVPITCQLTDIPIVTCPVKTCSYYTLHEKHNCLLHLDYIEDLDFHLTDVAKAKGVPIAHFKSTAQKSSRVIQRVMVIHSFLSWCDRKNWQEYPKIEAYRDPDLIRYIENDLLLSFPFNVSELPWNMGKICASVTDKWWKNYCKEKEIEFVSVSTSLGIKNRKVQEIQSQFSTAQKRAKSIGVNNG